jgi:glutaredoxin
LKTINYRSSQMLVSRACVGVAIGAAMLLLAAPSQAQTIYRLVGPDGKITYSDKPPAASANASTTSGASRSPSADGAALPFELRQVSSRFPVTLYTANNCAPCNAGRAMLSRRGVPFSEKTVNSAEDAAALQRISGENSLPFLTVGGQQIKGYSDAEWTQFIDAAGYPASSQLPASYRNPAATPLVEVQKPAPAAKPEAPPTTPRSTEPSSPANTPSNPAGITF